MHLTCILALRLQLAKTSPLTPLHIKGVKIYVNQHTVMVIWIGTHFTALYEHLDMDSSTSGNTQGTTLLSWQLFMLTTNGLMSWIQTYERAENKLPSSWTTQPLKASDRLSGHALPTNRRGKCTIIVRSFRPRDTKDGKVAQCNFQGIHSGRAGRLL